MSKINNLIVTLTLFITSISMVSANQLFTTENSSENADINGKWDMTAEVNGQSVTAVIVFKQEKDTFTGTLTTPMGSGSISNGKVKGNDITANVSVDAQGQQIEFTLNGKVDKGNLTGTMDSDAGFSFSYSAKKAQEKEKDSK